MSEKVFESDQALHEKLLQGIDILANNVASTLGPRGRNVILHKNGSNPVVTKDGVTVAEFVSLSDPVQNTGAQLIKQAATQTNSDAGDGTTTATVLARAILKNAQRALIAGSSPIELKRGMDKVIVEIVENLLEASRPISSLDDITHVATISANGDETIGKLIATAVDQAGKDGSITIEEARSVETSLDLVEGFRFDSGYVSSQFITDERRGVIRYSDPLMLVTDHLIENVETILPVLEVAARESKPLVIICENVEGQALAALIMNSARGTLKVAAIKAPRYGEERRNIMKDLCVSIGATYISRESGIQLTDIKLEHLGRAKTIEVSKIGTTIVDGHGNVENIDKRIDALKVELEQTESLYECERIQERITRLASGIAIIRVGGVTEVEMIERKHRIEDALEAVKSAQQEGIVPGGGVALVRATKGLKTKGDNADQELGAKIILESVREPLRQMARNAGLSADIILEKIEKQKGTKGIDFSTGQPVDLIEKGIIDPVKVTRSALQNAVSVASTILTTNHCIVEV